MVGIDHIPELINWSTDNVGKNHADLMESGRIKFIGKSNFVALRLTYKSDFPNLNMTIVLTPTKLFY